MSEGTADTERRVTLAAVEPQAWARVPEEVPARTAQAVVGQRMVVDLAGAVAQVAQDWLFYLNTIDGRLS